METLVQIMIPLCSGGAVWAFAKGKYQFGFILGCTSQPFWFYTTFTNEQWGMFAVCFWFTFHNVQGLRRVIKEVKI